MKNIKIILRVIFLISIMFLFCNNVNAEVKWVYVKNPKYKTELKKEYNKIPKLARYIYDENDLQIKIYGYNHYPYYAGLFTGNVYLESYNVSWLRSFYRRHGVKTNLSNKNLSINYAKCTLIHELGHAFDYKSGRLSYKSDFKKIYKKEKNKFKNTSYYRYPMGKIQSNINNAQEYFASAFTVYVRSPKDLKKYCPKTYKYFEKIFKKK